MTAEETFTVKYGGGEGVLKLIKALDRIIASEKSKLASTDVIPPYMHLWQEWMNRSILDNTTKAKLQRIILNRNRVKKYEQPRETMKLILDEIHNTIPPFRDNFDFVDDQNQAMYIVTMKNQKKTNAKSSTLTKDGGNLQPTENEDQGWTEPKTYAKAAKATPQLVKGTDKDNNRFEILAQAESSSKPGKDKEMTENDSDPDISYSKDEKQEQVLVEIDSDLSLSITSKAGDKEMAASPPSNRTPKQDSTITPRGKLGDVEEPESLQEAEGVPNIAKTKSNSNKGDQEDANDGMVDGVDDGVIDDDDNEELKDEFAEKQVTTAIANGTVDTLEVDLVARWINKKSTDVQRMTTTLSTHESFLMDRMTRRTSDLQREMKWLRGALLSLKERPMELKPFIRRLVV